MNISVPQATVCHNQFLLQDESQIIASLKQFTGELLRFKAKGVQIQSFKGYLEIREKKTYKVLRANAFVR
jgi:hypothetical protein